MAYLSLFVIILSFIVQLISAFVALRFIVYGKKQTAGLLMLLATALMTARRAISLFRVMRDETNVDLPAEITACIISFVLLAGFVYLSRLITYLQNETNRRSLAEKTLEETTAKLVALIHAIPDIVVFKDTGGRHMVVNRAAEQFIGMPQTELLGKSNDEILPPDLAAACRKSDEETMSSQKPVQFEEEVIGKDGQLIFLDTIKVSIQDDRGEPQGLVTVSRDITTRKQNEQNISRLSRQKELILNAAGEGIYGLDGNGTITFINPAGASMLGWTVEELIGRSSHDLFHHTKQDGSPYPIQDCPLQKSLLTGQTYNVQDELFWRKEGTSFPVDYISTPIIENDSVAGAVIVYKDVTARKLRAEALRMSEERLRLALTAGGQGLYDLDIPTGEAGVSPEYATMLGYDPAEFRETHARWIERLHPDDVERVTTEYQAYLSGKIPMFSIEFRQQAGNGDWKWILSHGKIVQWDADGRPLRMVGTHSDITERRKLLDELEHLNRNLAERVREEIEKNRAKEQSMQLQSRHAAMGEMIDNIGHQWRQPLNNLGLIIQGIHKKFREGVLTPEAMNHNAKIGMSLIQYMSQTINDFTNFFRHDKAVTTFRVKDVVATALSFMESSLKRNAIAVESDIGEDITIKGYRNEYSQVLVNILNNARDVFLERGTREPRITLQAFREEKLSVLMISDNGGGIPGHLMGRIFTPFFTTKEENKGTGIGLYMSKTIIEKNMNGRLSVSNNSEGAQFRIEVQHGQ